MTRTQQRLQECYNYAIESGPLFKGNLDNPDYCSLMYKAASNDSMSEMKGFNLYYYRCEYDGDDAVMFMFTIPLNRETHGGKHLVEKIMSIVDDVEQVFTTIDFCNSEEVKEDKFAYLIAIKRIKE